MTAVPDGRVRPRQMHLSLNLSGVGRHAGAWQHPASRPLDTLSVDHLVSVAQTAERGLLDAVFLADSPMVGTDPRTVPFAFEPLQLLSAIAAETRSIGLIGTVSTSYSDPRAIAGRAASLQMISGGRAAINAVASAGDVVAQNFGLDRQLDHATRYARTDAFLTAVRREWDVWFPTGRPLVVQAGGSVQGRQIAARHADVVYAGGARVEESRELSRDIAARALGEGRSAGSVLVLPGVIPYVAESEAAARALEARLNALHLAGRDVVPALSAVVGHDLTGYNPDGPLPLGDLPHEGDHAGGASMSSLVRTLAERDGLSIREAGARLQGGSFGNIQTRIFGTPETVADTLAAWFADGGDGYNLLPPLQPAGLDVFVDEVIPILQRKGVFRTSYEHTTLAGHLGLPTSPTQGSIT